MAAADAERFVIAAKKGDLHTLQKLHSKFNGTTENCFYDGMTALHEACRFGRTGAVQWLIDVAKVDVEKPDESFEGFRAIHWAVQEYVTCILF